MNIAVGTTSELKLRAVSSAFARAGLIVAVRGYKVESDVPKQPFSKEDIVLGAKNRAERALAEDKDAHYGIGIESGIVREGNAHFELAGIILVDKSFTVVGRSFSAAVETPAKIVESIKADDSEAGVVVGKLTGNKEKDPPSYYTGAKMKREELLEDAIFLSLSRSFLNPDAYL
ncbi:MAG: DUF84 family protein [Candidatus Sungbacteria bacterium]|nr:DUF84 family protein [Candidatus Sungbacteria bacterium]